ncbi:hypothetical protein IAR50_005781 [Cryptococcus sp. DSM 104548]
MKDAEREVQVKSVKGPNGSKKWVATERFSSGVGNPVRIKIKALERELKAGTCSCVHGFSPSSRKWSDVPNRIQVNLQSAHSYYSQLLRLSQSSFEFILPPYSSTSDPSARPVSERAPKTSSAMKAKGKQVGKNGKRNAVPAPSPLSKGHGMGTKIDFGL